jgi:large subunit ribosomal protein L10
MNRDQKAAAIAEIATHIEQSEAVFAVDYKGISVPQAAELRAKLRDADATFKVVKNSLTERAADQVGVDALKALLEGPTALTFVRGDAAVAAKALADYGRATQLLPFKGGFMEGAALDPEQIRALSRLPSREVLYGQLVGVVASPVSGLVRTLNALIGGLAVALGQVNEKKQSGEIPAGEPPAAATPQETATASDGAGSTGPAEPEAVPAEPEAVPAEAEASGVAEDASAESAAAGTVTAEADDASGAALDASVQPADPAPASAEGEDASEAQDAQAEPAASETEAESAADAAQSEPSPAGEPAPNDENQEADASEPERSDTAEANPTTKED